MMMGLDIKALTIGVVVKAIIIAPVAAAASTSDIWALVLVIVSATISGLFALLVNYLTIRENRRLHSRLNDLENRQADIAGAVGVGKRAEDKRGT